MKRSTFSDSQVPSILKLQAAGVPVSELAREYGVSTVLMKRPEKLEAENAQLKKMYAEERIEAELRQEALEGKL